MQKENTIDNFEQIKKLLLFEDESEFYFVQVLQRNKENRDLGKNNRLIKAYYINSLEKLDKYKQEMIDLSKLFNARVYIHLNRRDSKKIALEMMEDLAHCINSNQFELSKIYNSVCGRHHSKKDKSWVLDIDEPLTDSLQDWFYNKLYRVRPEGNKVLAYIPTKNGFHIITKPFDVFQSALNCEIHKNNPTVLYVPDRKYNI